MKKLASTFVIISFFISFGALNAIGGDILSEQFVRAAEPITGEYIVVLNNNVTS
jgi:hypothetical protein